ncbi:MAG: hypothetical protein KAH12_06690 [Anaerolineales bacterium]|nr:hypothetical protein [Anaerolineales bacterium]
MLEGLFGTANKEKILLYIYVREGGYPREVARYYGIDLRTIQNQFEKLELGSVLYSRMIGRTRLYTFNPRFVFLEELKQMLGKALTFYPDEEQERLLMTRRRPRRKGKPL